MVRNLLFRLRGEPLTRFVTFHDVADAEAANFKLVRQAADPLPTCQPLAVEVYDVDPGLLDGWAPPRSPDYRGRHGLRDPGD